MGIPHSELCCFGIVHKIFSDRGIEIGHHTDSTFFENWDKIDRADLKPFDVIWMYQPNDGANQHLGLYVGDGMMLHSMAGRGARLSKVSLYRKWIKGAYRWHG